MRLYSKEKQLVVYKMYTVAIFKTCRIHCSVSVSVSAPVSRLHLHFGTDTAQPYGRVPFI